MQRRQLETEGGLNVRQQVQQQCVKEQIPHREISIYTPTKKKGDGSEVKLTGEKIRKGRSKRQRLEVKHLGRKTFKIKG